MIFGGDVRKGVAGKKRGWSASRPRVLSDVVGKPQIMSLCKRYGKAKRILELGCGVDGFAYAMASFAKSVDAVDSSPERIRIASMVSCGNIRYHRADMRRLPLNDGSIDLCVSNLTVNNIKPDELPGFYNEVARVLSRRGRFVLLIPHPFYVPWAKFNDTSWSVKGGDYCGSRGKLFVGKLKTLDGRVIGIRMYHSLLEDHSQAQREAGLVCWMKEMPITGAISGKYHLYKGNEGLMPYIVMDGMKVRV